MIPDIMAKLSRADLEFRRESRSVSMINMHFVFVPKRRKPVLVGKVAGRMQEVIFEVVTEHRWKLIAQEVMPDHVHILVNLKPQDSASLVANRIKGRASKYLRSEFPHLCKLPCLWTPSYFVSTVGNASTETVQRYIEEQTGK